jgi:hypothetical protein
MSCIVEEGARYEHDPNAELDYTVDWAPWLPTGDTIATSIWIVPTGLTQPVGPTNTGTLAVIWLGFNSSVGTVGEIYRVTNRITTVGGRKDDRSFQVWIKEQ